jgi:hypothetical protein
MLKFGNLFEDLIGDQIYDGYKKSADELGSITKEFKTQRDAWKTLVAVHNAMPDATPQERAAKKQVAQQREAARHEMNLKKVGMMTQQKDTDAWKKKINASIDDVFGDKRVHSVEDAILEWRKNLALVQKSFEVGDIDADKYKTDLKSANAEAWTEILQGIGLDKIGSTLDTGKKILTNVVGNMIGDGITALVPELGPYAKIIGKVISELLMGGIMGAITQLISLNDILVDLQRSTGGTVTALKMGYDNFGNLKTGADSFATSAIQANVSVKQVMEALNSLAGSGTSAIGQITGLSFNLRNAQSDLRDYGVEAARFAKLYGADIGNQVRGMITNFGATIPQATNVMKKSADQAMALGLSVGAMAENMKEAVDLSGKVYFKDGVDGLRKLSLYATQLGTSVNSLAGGISKTNSISDLFNRQQEAAALGLSRFGQNMAKVYALRVVGKAAEASQLETQSLAKDLVARGMVNKGQITTPGIMTASAAGASEEQIRALQRLAAQANRTGISLDMLADPTAKLTIIEKVRLQKDQAANMKIEEQFNMLVGEIKQTFIDPLAKIFGPILVSLLQALDAVIKPILEVFKMLFDVVDLLFSPIEYVVQAFSGLVSDVFDPLTDTLKAIRIFFEKIITAGKGIFEFLTKVFFTPFRILTKIIGGVVSVFGAIIEVLSDIFSPLLDAISSLFGDASEGLDDLVEAVGEGIKWIVSGIKSLFIVIGEPLKFLIQAIVNVVKALNALFHLNFKEFGKLLWEALKSIFKGVIAIIMQPFKLIYKILVGLFEPLRSILSPLVDAFNWLMDGLKGFGDWLDKFFGLGDTVSPNSAVNLKEVLGLGNDNLEPESPSQNNIDAQSTVGNLGTPNPQTGLTYTDPDKVTGNIVVNVYNKSGFAGDIKSTVSQ